MMGFNKKSVDDFKVFLDRLMTSDMINASTARNLKNSSLRLLTAISDTEKADIYAIDVDDLIKRFSVSVTPPPSDASLNTYKSRFEKALELFTGTGGVIEAKSNQHETSEGRPSEASHEDIITIIPEKGNSMTTEDNKVKTFVLPIPLREDLTVEIKNLPRDLSEDEASRIALIIQSFAIKQ
ncbi:hypothetical protein OKT22_03845 [Providencia rettgeri]|uniref:hypothetical protein n=1 Tax=Providencia TaxID=586 RepID=UPI0019D2A374|nr:MULTISPECIES: hypothetical protein [Providencia]MBN6364321.1 hypothetical protein [Providencia rettgeri]MCX9108161.1 hypothetical protein [Providencia rettgeri]